VLGIYQLVWALSTG